ncbi:MAG TPA: hypothetical protein VGQ35_14715 [Dongiaceae bacterium]|jgi:hypothetical protein|nr:hypothetical protein [Dongiaceae bacterium]
MLRWYLASLVFLLVISPAIGFGVYHYVMTHPAEPGTLAGRVYEKTVKAKLLRLCTKNMKEFAGSDATNTEEQLDAACHCFTDDMFEQFRHVPPGDLDAMALQSETQRNAEAIFRKCVNQSGLN